MTMPEQIQPARWLRSCGHPSDATFIIHRLDGYLEVYCFGCLIEKSGLKPSEILSVEEFSKKYLGVR